MSVSNSVYNNLRQKLDVLGYTQTLPLASIPLVGAIFEDLVKTTESLRDAKGKIVGLLEEKSAWELGVEPYKCDNSRLLSECNDLHLQLLKQREELEERTCELNQRIRNLQIDKSHLDQHCVQLQQEIKTLLAKQATSRLPVAMKQKKDLLSVLPKKPFITTVRSGEKFQTPLTDNTSNIRCTKCNAGYYQKSSLNAGGSAVPANSLAEIEKLERDVKDLTAQVEFYKRKIEARDREIRRLNDLLTGGRPAAALAKDCCYKDVGKLTEDVDLLQREKSELLVKIRQYEEQMHEAMQRALDLETQNKQLLKELDELKEAALSVETQANKEIEERENEIKQLQYDLKQLKDKRDKLDASKKTQGLANARGAGGDTTSDTANLHKLYVEECERESKLRKENEVQMKKIIKLQHKLHHLQKEIKDKDCRDVTTLDEDKIRLKSERDFFQKEYLRLISKTGSEKEVEFLQNQVKSKDEELRILRSELCLRQEQIMAHATATANAATTVTPSLPLSARSIRSQASDCVQAIVLRAERERDCARVELERVRCERDALREKHLHQTQMHAAEIEKQQLLLRDANERIKQLELETRDLQSARLPSETQIVLLKEEIAGLKKSLFELQDENSKLRISQGQLKLLHEQTERALVEYQNKLLIAETHLETAEQRVNTLDSNRETTRSETTLLRSEVAALKKTYVSLENEKDKILAQLDAKTERAYQLEYELKACKEKRNNLEQQVNELEKKLEKLKTKTRERDTALHETSAEGKALRQQIAALKTSRDQAIAENGRLTNELADSQAEILTLKKRLKDSELEIERLKQQLHQYVQEVKKAEDLLMHKEKEREEMLEHYRSLSHDAVMLEGNNQSLEVEAAEYKRQVSELEAEIDALKKELCCRNALIDELEDKISTRNSENTFLERQLEEAMDAQCALKVDLTAQKELCEKLDIEKDKLNAELIELNQIKGKLERDNEILRSQVDKKTLGNQTSIDTLEELLSKTRRDLEEQLKVDSKLSQELVRLRKENEKILNELDNEREKRRQQEALAHEYEVQNQELRHNITDDRFRQARSREQSPRFPVSSSSNIKQTTPTTTI